MKTVEVKFDPYGKSYHYLFPYDEEIVKGDQCVVLVNNEYKIVKILEVLEGSSDKATRPVVCKINELPYHNYLERDRKRKNLKALLDKKVKEFNEFAVYEALLKNDPTVSELIKELKEII